MSAVKNTWVEVALVDVLGSCRLPPLFMARSSIPGMHVLTSRDCRSHPLRNCAGEVPLSPLTSETKRT